MSIWADKIVVYLVRGGDAAAFYAAIAAVAWFSVIPAFAWIYVQVETAFYQRFRSFYAELESGRAAARAQAARRADLRRGQAHPARRGRRAGRRPPALVIAAAPRIVASSGCRRTRRPLFRLAALGAGLQVFSLLEVLLLYLLRSAPRRAGDLRLSARRRDRADPASAAAIGWPPVIGHLVACAISSLLGLVLVRRRLQTLVLDTFQSQPFGVA